MTAKELGEELGVSDKYVKECWDKIGVIADKRNIKVIRVKDSDGGLNYGVIEDDEVFARFKPKEC